MKENVFSQRCRWSILVLILGLSGCEGGEDTPMAPEMIPINYDISQDQLNQWNANNEVNANPAQIADLTIVGCVSST